MGGFLPPEGDYNPGGPGVSVRSVMLTRFSGLEVSKIGKALVRRYSTAGW